jgi:hypothetical protein
MLPFVIPFKPPCDHREAAPVQARIYRSRFVIERTFNRFAKKLIILNSDE